jgi:hypothetical protein
VVVPATLTLVACVLLGTVGWYFLAVAGGQGDPAAYPGFLDRYPIDVASGRRVERSSGPPQGPRGGDVKGLGTTLVVLAIVVAAISVLGVLWQGRH